MAEMENMIRASEDKARQVLKENQSIQKAIEDGRTNDSSVNEAQEKKITTRDKEFDSIKKTLSATSKKRNNDLAKFN